MRSVCHNDATTAFSFFNSNGSIRVSGDTAATLISVTIELLDFDQEPLAQSMNSTARFVGSCMQILAHGASM